MQRFRPCRFLTAWIVLTLSAATLCAQPAADRLDRAAVLRAAQEITREKHPNADDVLVDDLIVVEYQPDGTALASDDTWLKVLTEKGRRENQTLQLHFTLPYETVEVAELEVIRPDGSAVAVDVARQSRVSTDDSQMGQNIYNPNQKVLAVGVPGLQAGDVVHYRTLRRTVKARVPDTWSDYMVFEYTSPIRRMEYIVRAPKERPLRAIALRDEVKGAVRYTVAEEGERLVHRWIVSDVPRVFQEPDMPPLHTCVQRLLVSTIPDWKDISRWYWRLSEPHLACTDAMKQQAADLARDAAPRERIERIFRFVSQQIRYMGITTEAEAPGYEPHDAQTTFEKRYGVCRDKAALLVALLRAADIAAYPALIHNGPRKDPDVPQPWFNHAIVAVREANGAWLLMDPTDENTKDLFPSYLANQSYLVATPEGEPLHTSPIIPAEQNLVRIETRGALSADGRLTAESVFHFEGVNDGAYRGYFSRVKPEERRQFFEGLAKRAASGAVLTALEITPADVRDTTQPLVARIAFEAPDTLVTGREAVMVPLPRFGARVGLVNFILGRTGLKERRFPLVTEFACGVAEQFSLDVAAALGPTLSLPEDPPIESDAVRFRQNVIRQNGKLVGAGRFDILLPELTPAQYLGLKDALKAMEFMGRRMPLFAPLPSAAPAAADMRVLSETVAYDLDDARSWTETRSVRRHILTYAGAKQYAELKLPFNPVWDEVAVEHAAVTSAAGVTQAVRAEEMNVMDADWVGAAPRYPAGRLLVVSLPGVEPGSLIEYRIRRTVKDRPFFVAQETFQGFNPVAWKQMTVEAPDGLAMTTQTFFAERLTADERRFAQPRRLRSWLIRNADALPREPAVPPSWLFLPTVRVSCADTASYAALVRETLHAAAADAPEARRLALELTRAAATVEAKLRAVRDHVARAVRLAGPAFWEIPLSAVTPADRTLADGYGNTTDRAVVLFALLKAAGLAPEFVLASSTPEIPGVRPPFLAGPGGGDFDAVLVRVKAGGDFIYLNDSDQYAALGATDHHGCYGLALDTGAVEILRAPEDKITAAWAAYRIVVQPNGDAAITRTRRYLGTEFESAHRKFAEMPPEERRRYQQEAVAQIAQSAEAAQDLVTRFDGYPGEEEVSVTVRRFAVRDGDFLYFQLPDTLRDLLGLRADTRENPLYWPQPRRVVIETMLQLPPGFQEVVLSPQPYQWKAPSGAGRVEITQESRRTSDGEALVIRQQADLRPAILSADVYANLLKCQRELSHPRARMVLLRAAPPR